MDIDKKELGKFGEDIAAKVVSCKGYRIITRNYRCKYGEIDIIASRGNSLHFIEVKTRQGLGYGRPCESVTPQKQEHIRKAAVFYLDQLKRAGYAIPDIHFQVIEVTIEQIEDAF